jgi:hypothetical protein
MAHVPGGVSVKNFLHHAQSISTGKFQLYDYGSSERNKKVYGP